MPFTKLESRYYLPNGSLNFNKWEISAKKPKQWEKEGYQRHCPLVLVEIRSQVVHWMLQKMTRTVTGIWRRQTFGLLITVWTLPLCKRKFIIFFFFYLEGSYKRIFFRFFRKIIGDKLLLYCYFFLVLCIKWFFFWSFQYGAHIIS